MESQSPGKSWVQIVVALIGGAAIVLAALLPILHSSRKNLENATKVADNESDALKRKVADLEARLRTCEAEKEKAEECSPGPPPTKGAEPAADEKISYNFKFKRDICKLDGANIDCEFIVTNLLGDRELSVAEGRIIDESGTVYPATGYALGVDSYGSFSRAVLPGEVPVRLKIRFGSVRPGTKRLQVLEIGGYNWPASGGRDHIEVQFRNIAL